MIIGKKVLQSICVIMLSLSSCKSPTDNKIDNGPSAKRNYVWSIDSVDYGERPSSIELSSIWGSTATDVWGAAGDAPDVRDCLWHYDGKKWSRATEGTPITEPTGNKVVYAVWGTDKNNVWAFGGKINFNILSAFIMHFDGATWSDVTPSHIVNIPANLYAVYPNNKNDIWVTGYEYILHFDGIDWKAYKVADSLIVAELIQFENTKYVRAYSPWGREKYYLFKFTDGNQFTIIDSTQTFNAKFGALLKVSKEEIFSYLRGVKKTKRNLDGTVDTNGWVDIFKTEYSFAKPFIFNPNNIFIVGQGGLLYNYNGLDWQQIIINLPQVSLSTWLVGVWTNGDEILVCDIINGLIYHGK